MKTTDAERLKLIQEFLNKLEKIENLEEIVRGTKGMIKKHRADGESILNRLRELDEGVLPFGAQEPPEPEEEDEEDDEEEDVEVDLEDEEESVPFPPPKPPAGQPEGGLQ